MNEEADETALVSPVDGTFCFKKRTDGSVDKSTVVCKLCKKEFAYHRSTSSLKYHLNAKHIAASVEASVDVSPTPSTRRTHTQPTLNQMTGFRARITKSTSEQITNSLAHWIALDCRPLGVVEDKGLQKTVGKSTKSVMASEATERCFLIVRVSNVLNVLESIVFYLKTKCYSLQKVYLPIGYLNL